MKNKINKIILFLTIILVIGFVFATASFAADTWSSKWTSSTPYATGASTGAGKISNNDKPTDYNSWKNNGTILSRERLNYYRVIGDGNFDDEDSDYTISRYKHDIAKANGARYPKEGYRGEDYIETDSGEKLYVWKAASYTAGYNMDMGNQGDVSGKTLLAINDGTHGTGSTVTSGKMLLFLHRTPFYMTVFENSRTRWMYSEETGYTVNGMPVKTEETMPASMVEGRSNGIKGITSVMEELSKKMLPYVVNTYTMSYSPVPHVLGTEGTSAYSSVAGNSLYDGKYMAIALMDETNEQPVPVLIPVAGDNNTDVSNITPFWSFQGENLTENQSTYVGKNILQSDGNYWVFQDGMTENGAKIQPYVKLDDIIQADLYASGKTNVYPSGMVHVANNIKDSYNAIEHSFKLPYASENLVRDGVKEQDIGLGYRNYLEEAIVQMRYPFLVSSVSLALDETITQRNSSVQFMSAIISNYTARAVVDSGVYDWGQTYNFANKGNEIRRYIAGGFASYIKNGQIKNTNDNLFAGKDRNKKFNGRAILFRFAEDSIDGTDIYTPLVVAQSVGNESAYENNGKGINFKTSGITFIRSFGQREARRSGEAVKTLDIHYIRMPMKVFSRSIVTEPVYTTINGVKYPAFRNIYRDKENGSTDATGFTYGFHSFYSLGRYGDGYENTISGALSNGNEITDKIIEKTVPTSGMSAGTYSHITNDSANDARSRITAWSYQKNDDFGTWRGVGFTPSGLDTYSSFPGETTNYDFATSGFANMNGIIRYPWSDRGNKRSGYYYNKIYLENIYGKINNIDIIQSPGNTLLAELNRDDGNAEEIMNSVSDAVIRTFEDKVSNDPTVVLSIRDMVNSSNGTKTGQKDFSNASSTGFTSRAYDIDMSIYNSFEKEYCKALTMEKVGPDVQSDANFIVEDNAKFGRVRYSKKCQNDAPLSSGNINLMNGYYTDSYSALLEAWDKPTAKHSNISYKEYLAYIYFQYFSIEQLSSDYAWGRTMRYKGSSSQNATSNINTTKTYYSNGTIYRGQFANIWLLNEEDRLNNKLQYGKDSSGKSIYFSDVMKNNLADHSDNIADGVHVVVPSSADEKLENITDYDLKSKFGPELFLVDNVSGNYSTGNKTLSCEPGYTKNGDVCTAIFKAARNPVCEKDFKYNEALGLCIRVDKTPMQCPAYYTLFNGFCVRYNGTEEICRDGEHYDSNMKACIIYKDGRCDAGWTPDVSNGTCVRIVEKSCPFGGELINDKCVVKRGEYKGTFQNKETLDFDTSAIGKSLTLNPGRYLLEAWGAQGGGAQGGKGGYSSGVIEIKEKTTVYINVGSSGANAPRNGGGVSTVAYGGGASDIRIGSNDLSKRVLVAGGGGGSITVDGNIYAGGYAGGWIASDGNSGAEDAQIAGSGASIGGGTAGYNGTDGEFGHGGNCKGTNCAGGGGGYYGGGAGFSGGGGTGFAWADNTNHYAQNTLDEKYKLTKVVVDDGDSSFVDFNGNEVVGNSGNGHVRISSFENAQYTCEHVALLDGEKVELESSYIGQSYEFDSKGHCEIWYAPVSGRYLLETWGASGGESFYHGAGGKGGYSAGYVDLKQGDPLNVCVGGAGAVGANGAQENIGGFNGGGSTTGFGGAGGGMTSISTSKNVKDSIIVAGGGGGGGRGSNYSEEVLDDSIRTTMRDDYHGYDSVVYLKADKGQRVQIVIGRYFADGSANVPYEIAYYSSDPSSIVNSQSGSGWFNKFENTFEKLYSGYYLLSNVPNRWGGNFNNLVELTTFTAPYDGYYIAYTHYRPGSSGSSFDSVLGVKVYTVLTHTDDSGNAGAGGGVNGMNSVKGVEVDISGYGGTASKNAGIGTGGDSSVGGAGGGGWYGGNGATFQGGGGGGSGYIKAGTIVNGITIDGTKSFKTTKSTSASMSYETGHFGDGHAKITLYSGEDFNGDVLTGSTKGTLSGTSNVGLWVVPDRTKTINFCKVTSPYDRTEIDDSYFENIYYKNFGFTGSTQTVTLEPGQYIVEAWGAQGGSTDGYDNGGKGGYVSGTLNVSKTTTYTIVVGGKGGNPTVNGGRGGFGAGGSGGGAWTNGATSSASVGGGGGGGLSGIFNGTEPIIVAGGGGGGAGKYAGGYGGGGNGTGLVDSVGGKGGLADSANTSGKYVTSVSGGYNTNKHPTYGQIGGKLYGGAAESGNFEEAQAGNSTTFAGGIPRSSEYSYANGMLGAGGGGGGYYGGNGGNGGSLNRPDAWGGSGGGGSNYTGAVAGGTSKNGSEIFISPAGGNETGHSGNGAIRIRGTRFVDVGTNYIKEFSYTGQTEVITLKPGTYKFQVWGAQGGGTNGGKGGYSEGQMVIKEDTTIYINVGGKGTDAYAAGSSGSTTNNLGGAGGFNGGGGGSNGYSTYTGGSGGGGASDIRIGQNSLYARVIVAGGGGGMGGNSTLAAGHGGGETSGIGYGVNGRNSSEANQTTGNAFGIGGGGRGTANNINGRYGNGGGGGGWFGGRSLAVHGENTDASASGGSGFVFTADTIDSTNSRYTGGTWLLTNKYYLLGARTTAGNVSFESPTGATEVGHSGNGYIRISGVTTNDSMDEVGTVKGFSYTGDVQAVTLNKGIYKLEAWGAQGGDGRMVDTNTIVPSSGGKGGYTTATFEVKDKMKTVYVYVGGKGGTSENAKWAFGEGGWNGGAPGGTELSGEVPPENGAGGGGMTHFSLASDDKIATKSEMSVEGSGTVYNFDYTGTIQQITLDPGTYKLETWGAQGGSVYDGGRGNGDGGKGGYSVGEITLTTRTTLYIGVGGKGIGGKGGNSEGTSYNGGGVTTGGRGNPAAAGGGATHIATANGLLKNLASNQSSVLIVAGGGGGASHVGYGGVGGGTTGGKPVKTEEYSQIAYTTGGTQTSGGGGGQNKTTILASFGQGATGYASAGGGGGWYGGGTTHDSSYFPAAGGSGHVNASLKNAKTIAGDTAFKAPGGSNETGHSGNGYARITAVRTITKNTTYWDKFNRSDVLIVAGGGGGATGHLNTNGSTGGAGGGTNGLSTNAYTTGGTQTSGSKYGPLGEIGYSHTDDKNYGSIGGGGGGWYGGKIVATPTSSVAYGGAGGSGYVNTSHVTNGSTAAGVREGNGYAQITVLQPPVDYKIDKSKYYYDVRAKYDKTCEFGYEETIDGMCRKIENIKCDTGYSWNAPKAKCEFYESPIGCTSEGKIITSTSGNRKQWACGYTQDTTCPDGYKKDGGLCISTKNATANPDVCPSGYTDKGTYCERVISKSLKVGSVTGDIEKASALTGKNLVVELGQVYSFRNYVGYNASLSRAYANKKGNMTSSIFFPQVSTNVWLFNTKFGTTGCERRGEENCDITAENSAIQIPITVSDTKIFNGNKPYLGNNTASSGFSQEAMKYIQNNPDVVLATYPRQVNINENTGRKTIQAYLASHLFAYYYRFNAYGTGGAEFQDRYALVEFVFKVDTDGIYVLNRDGDGTLPLDTTSGTSSVIDWSKAKVIKYNDIVKNLTDDQIKNFLEAKDNPDGTKAYSLKTRNEKGEQQINSIAFVSSIDSLSPVGTQNIGMLQEVQGMGAQNLSEEKKRYMMMDNGITSDDTSALVAEFKAAVGDVYIDRIEIVDDNGKIIKTYDAMIEGRCTNPVDDGYTEAFAGKTYEEVSNMKPEDAIGCVEIMNPTTNKVPNLRLSNTNNYEVRIYTKYIDKNEVKVDPNVKEVNLEIIHSADGGSKSIAQYLTSKGQQDDVMYIASGKEDRTNIIHDQTAKFAYSMGWLPGKTDKYTVSGTIKDITVESLESNYKDAGSQAWADNAQPLLIPLKAIAKSNQGGISTGNYTAKIGTASNSINKEKIWDEIVFSYNTGDAPDNKVYFEIECLKKDGGWGQLNEQDGTCLMVSSNVYTSKCKVYAIVERNKPDGVDTTTMIKWNSGNSPTTILEAGTLKDAGNQDKLITNIGDKEKIFLEEIALPLKNLYYSAYVEHYSEYNNFTDVNPADNYDNVCINYNKVNYKVANLTATITGGGNTDSTIYQISDKDSDKKTTVTIKGVFDIEKIFETSDLDKRDIKTEVIFEHPTDASVVTGTGGGACKIQVTNNSSSAGHVGVVKAENFSKSGIPYEMTCVVDNSKIKAGSELKVTVKINGGKTATGKEFDESNYGDNEAYTRIQTNQAGDHKPIICKEDKCVQQNKWDILFDFVYRYDSKVESYKTNQNVYMKWTDYAVPKWGTDKTYVSPITGGVGNELRYPKDYMAFFSDRTDYTQLCTDYRNGNGECWRYEMNTRHTVEYYKKSTAVTSLYTTLKTLPYSGGAGTALAGPACNDKNRSDFGAGGTAAVDKMGGNAGRTSHWAETVSTDRNKNICHGYNDATEYSAPSSRCEYVVDWWGNDICIAEENQFDEDATTAKHPNDYITYAYFGTASGKNSGNATNTVGGSSVGYILNDGNGLGRSDTTKTIRIVLQNTTSQGRENQGKEGTVANGWIYTRKMDVCTDYAYSDIKYHCDRFFQYGTYGNKRYFKQTTKNGNGVCYEAKYDEGERTCEWTNTSQTPPETIWWNDSGATCYRQHADYTCSTYHGVGASEPTIDNNKAKGNKAEGICRWSVSVHPTVENETWTFESDSDSDSASSSSYDCNCHKCGCDASGNNCDTCCDTCYTTETAHCHASVTCDSDSNSCTASGGGSCSVSCYASASYVDYRLRWSHSGWNDETREYDHECSVSRPNETFARQQEAETGGTSTSYSTPTDSESFADINDFSVNYMTRTCVGHDVEDYGGRNGGYCYETYVDADKGKENLTQKSTPINGSSADRGDFGGQDTAIGGVGKMMCIRWKSVEYKEIKYVTTASPKDTFVSRNYDTEAKISQWRCSSKTPSKYPDVAVAMRYEETFTSTMYISTNRTGGEWVELKKDENGKPQIDRDILPRNGEYMGVKVVSQYKTTRGTKPGEMPYLTGFYNNYHNIVSGDNDHEIKAPTNYTHFNYNDAVFAESVATTNYGYCNARVAEPYGCEMNQYANQRYTYTQDNYANTNTVSRNTQFAVPADGTAGVDGSIDHTQIQGNDNLDWRSENAGMSGVCYFGPDDKYKWATGNLNTNLDIYYADGSKVTETASLDGKEFGTVQQVQGQIALTSKGADGKEERRFYPLVGVGKCNLKVAALCVDYSVEWTLPMSDQADGTSTNKIYFDIDNSYEGVTLDFANKPFYGVGKYEELLLGTRGGDAAWGNSVNNLSGLSKGKYFNNVDGNILPLCACQSVTIPPVGEVGWGTTEWEIS